jgi:tetratricopeptide (TPR) repeat protein
MTVILLAAALVVALAVPTLREAFSERAGQVLSPTHGNYPSPSQLAEIVSESPRDPQVQYAYALALWSNYQSSQYDAGGPREPTASEDVAEALRHAISLMPDDPAPRLSLAIFEIDRSEIERVPLQELPEGETRPEPTEDQLAHVHRARELLVEVRELDPDNAAADYLLAWTWLADGDAERAVAAASRGAAKDRWTTYKRRRVETLLTMLDRTPVPGEFAPMAAIAINSQPGHSLGPRLRSMARGLRARADELRAQGRHEAAIDTYNLLLRAGHLMRTDARDILDGLFAAAISTITVTSDDWAPPDEERVLEKDENLTKTDLRAARFADYLREHGRGDLADFAEAEMAAAQRWKDRSSEAIANLVPALVEGVSGGPAMNAGAIFATAGAILLLAIVIGLLSLIARYWREPRDRPRWTHLQWLGLLAILLLPGQFRAWVAMKQIASQGAQAGNAATQIMLLGVGASVFLWLIAVLVLTLRKRRALSPEQRLSRPRAFLRGLRAIVLPTLAALVLLCMPATYAIETNLERMGDRYRELALQGEVEYHGLQAETTTSGRGRPASDQSSGGG